MGNSELNEELSQFIRKHLRSVEQMEILLCLLSSGFRPVTVQQIYEVVKSNRHSIEQRLETFLTARLIVHEAEGYRLNPADAALPGLLEDLKHHYRERPVKVIEAIIKSQDETISDFADAFKLRKK